MAADLKKSFGLNQHKISPEIEVGEIDGSFLFIGVKVLACVYSDTYGSYGSTFISPVLKAHVQ